jgi:hypothetical protein
LKWLFEIDEVRKFEDEIAVGKQGEVVKSRARCYKQSFGKSVPVVKSFV